MKKIIALMLTGLCSSCFALSQPKLIVQVVVDQFRGDFLAKYQDKFSPNGFNYLTKHGIWYANANHPHANTTTCVGHSSIATGAYPRYHGMVGNSWYDIESNEAVDCVGDEKVVTLNFAKVKKTFPGRSPKNLLASTFSDELILSQKGRAFAVSYKDRAAITMAGHAGIAYWFDKINGGFITSDYYYKEYPRWVSRWNEKRLYETYHGKTWRLSKAKSDYFYQNNEVYNDAYAQFGKSFPHQFSQQNSPYYFKTLMLSPFSDSLAADFAKQLLINEKLGQSSKKTDYLSVSFSSNDAIGHNFGPNSLEAEENLLALDKTLAQLFNLIDKKVGLDKTLIILSADHGVSDSPEYLASHHIATGRINIEQFIKESLQAKLKRHFKVNAPLIKYFDNPYVYLNHQAIKANSLSIDEVARFVCLQLNELNGISHAFSFKDIEDNKVNDLFLSNKVWRMDAGKRAGDVYVIPQPYWSIVKDKNDDKVSHGSPWTYDSFVPIVFASKQFSAHYVTRKVESIDIAPTLSVMLGIKKPSSSTGQALPELVSYYHK
jgi:predicted AlkP superfamily pyrophosphatase or phosphodiesterase